MEFIIQKHNADNDKHEWNPQVYSWTLEKQGNALASSPTSYPNEDEARASVAVFRKAAGGCKFAKVVGP